MFRVGGIDEHPLHIHPRLLERESDDALFPILVERTPVRLDLSHSAWSDIFFLGMDFPEGARVLNISVDLGVHGRDAAARSADRVPGAGDRRADPAADQHRPERLQGRREPGGAVQLRQRLPRAGQGRRDRLGPGAPLPRGNDHQAGRPAGAGRPARAWAGDRQQGQRHSQGVAAGRLDQPAGVADRAPDAGDRPDPQPDRAARPRGGAGGRGPGDPGRMAGRLGRRLARLGGDFSRHQADPGRGRRRTATRNGASAGAGCCPLTACSTAGPREPAPPAGEPAAGPAPVRGRPGRRAWCWCTAAWPRTSGRSSTWSRPSTCCAATRNGWRASRRCGSSISVLAAVDDADVRALGHWTTENWNGPLKAIIPWVTNVFTESIIAAGPARLWATISGGS